MKTLLFNGCSFTCGDAFVWDLFTNEYSWYDIIQEKLVKSKQITLRENFKIYGDYDQFRRDYNLPAQCAKILNTTKVDLSEDGNSNDGIAFPTINYLMRLSPEARRNTHVCIGWTSPDRRIKYHKGFDFFKNLSTFHYVNEGEEYLNFVQSVLIEGSAKDHMLNYLLNIILLENYLKLNKISYTFWRTLALPIDIEQDALKFINSNPKHDHKNCLPVYQLSDRSKWIPFADGSIFPWTEKPWDWTLKLQDKVSKENQHPNIDAVIQFANTVCDYIKKA